MRGRALSENHPDPPAQPVKDPESSAPDPSPAEVTIEESAPAPTEEAAPPEETAPTEDATNDAGEANDSETSGSSRRRILIGSQRDPAAYRARRSRDWKPLPETKKRKPKPKRRRPGTAKAGTPAPKTPPAEQAPSDRPTAPVSDAPPAEPVAATEEGESSVGLAGSDAADAPAPPDHIPPPNLREMLSPEEQEEMERALGDAPVEELMADGDAVSRQQMLEEDSRHTGRVVAVQRDDVFIELGSREQGCLPVKLFDPPPEVDTVLEVVVQRFNLVDLF